MKNKLVIACEHAAYEMKEKILRYLEKNDIAYDDLGVNSSEPVDYPFIAANLAEKVSLGKYKKGILLCGTGIGVSIASGKVPGVRTALCTNAYMAKMARKHNDVNILCLGAWITGERLTFEIIDAFLSNGFDGDRHTKRVNQLKELENRYSAHIKE